MSSSSRCPLPQNHGNGTLPGTVTSFRIRAHFFFLDCVYLNHITEEIPTVASTRFDKRE